MVFDKNCPLLIFPNRYNSFNDYFNSLSKSAKKGLKSTIKKNLNTSYKKLPLDVDTLREYMELWELQPLSDGTYPHWGEWTPEFISSLDIEVLMFGAYHDNKLISIHFLFKWDRYLYCNAPLYDKSLYSEMEISKFMWIKLIEWSIVNDIEYLDMMGEGENSWISSIKNRPSSNEPGSNGYKWKFVSESDKNNLSVEDLRTNSCKKCNHKWIEKVSDPLQCKCKNLLIVAHADDEVVFFGNWLEENKESVYVVCICSDRRDEFIKSMDYFNIDRNNYEIWNHKADLDVLEDSDELKDQLYKLREKHNWNKVITHSRYGEYGHIQHIEVHDMVTDVFNNDIIYVYELTDKSNINNKMDIINQVYPSEIQGLTEIKMSECTGSDWYKHSIHHNLLDYGSIIKYNKTLLNISLFLPNNSYNSYIVDIGNELEKRGHIISYNNTSDNFIKIGFSTSDMDMDILFLLENISDKVSNVDILNTISKTKRTIVGSQSLRDQLKNPLNVTHMGYFDTWDRLIRNIESNILLSLKWSSLNKIKNLFTSHNLFNDKLNILYMGDTIIGSIIKFYNKNRILTTSYSNDLIKDNWHFFYIDPSLIGESIFIKVSKNDDLIFSQIIYL